MRGIIIATPISLLMWAAIIYGVMCATAKAMDDVTIAGVYAVDRSLCRLYVDQDTINRHLANVVVQYDISPSEAILEAARVGTVLKQQVEQSGRVAEYCAARTKR